MPKLAIPDASAQIIDAAATLYERELSQLISAREGRATANADEYRVSQRLEEEIDDIQVALRIRSHLEDDHIARLAGINLRDSTCRVIHSALLLQRAAFVRELTTLPRNAPAQQDRGQVLRAAIDRIDGDISRIWHQYGTSELFPEVLLRWRLRNSPEHLHPLIAWIESNGGARSRAWFVTDTNFFLESRATFEQVDWHRVWGVDRVVLVVPAAMVRELDDMKGNVRRPKLQQRAKQVLPLLTHYAEQAEPGMPGGVRDGVELLVLDTEPQAFPSGFDASLADDRLIATALELRQALIEADVRLVSQDVGPRAKIRRFELGLVSLPDTEQRSDEGDEA